MTEITLEAYPAQMPLTLAALVWIEGDDDVGAHEVSVEFSLGDRRFGRAVVNFNVERSTSSVAAGGDRLAEPAPFVMDLRPVSLPTSGVVTIEVRLDEERYRTFQLRAQEPSGSESSADSPEA